MTVNGEITLRLSNRALLVVLAVLGLVWLLGHATHLAVVFFLAVLLAAAVSAVANGLARFHIKRAVAILLAYVLVLGVLAGLVALLVPLIGGEIAQLRANLPAYRGEANGLLARFPHTGSQPLRVDDLLDQAGGALQGAAGTVGKGVVHAGTMVATLLLIFVFAFFLAVDERFAERVVGRFFPPATRGRALGIMGRMGTGLGYWVRAQLLLALFFGVAFGVGLAVMRMPYALTLALIGGVLEVIPYVGGFVTIALAVLIGATTGKLWLVVAAVVWYAVVVNVEAHLVAPKLVGEIVGLHPLVIVVALYLGAETLGILGALLAVPLAVVLQILLDEFWTFGAPPPAAPPGRPAALPLQPGAGAPRPDHAAAPARGD
ncbi:MAG TPA: AI-2E family transporter [Thermomicrobiales bacterium]|nr:AI-2E family transporter [Thermomicrobiales bacterium]